MEISVLSMPVCQMALVPIWTSVPLPQVAALSLLAQASLQVPAAAQVRHL